MAKLPRRKCKVCREWFPPAYSNVVWCCPEHGAIYALELRAKEKSKAAARCIRGKHQADKAEPVYPVVETVLYCDYLRY